MLSRVGTFVCALSIAAATLCAPAHAVPDPDVAWLFDESGGKSVPDAIGAVNGVVNGAADWVSGLEGNALKFDGETVVELPDSPLINSGGPFPKRTILATFSVDDAGNDAEKQTIFEEGGRTRGLVMYVFDGDVWVGGWNRAEYNWNGEWISAPIKAKTWYQVGLVIRDADGSVEDDRFEMWLNGTLVEKRPGGQLHAHGDDNGIGAVNQNTVFHDEAGSGDNIDYFTGLIDDVRLWQESLVPADIETAARGFLAVDAQGRLATRWASLKTRHASR
ncbi:hypothetical protein CMK11_11545 [Candidatus Poribacteria bacterium]|nr:hypothetical protein [Candidatus Poribacteria bacterium]